MKAYLDESYPGNKSKLILGGLFLSNNARSSLFHIMHDIKAKYGITGELKYVDIYGENKLNAAKEIIETVMQTKSAQFVAYIIPYSSQALQESPGIGLSNRRIGLYVHYAYDLVRRHTPKESIIDVFCDREERIAKTKLYKKLKNAKIDNGAIIRGVTPVDSKSDQHCIVQITDLLTGAVLQNIFPSTSINGKYKMEFAKHFSTLSKIDAWDKSSTVLGGKVIIKYQQAPDFNGMKWRRKHKKSRS